MNTSSPFIQATGIHKSYLDAEGNKLHILRGVDLAVERGKTVAIMGASGTGKSTLLHLLGALDRPDQGETQVNGTALSSLKGDAMAEFRNRTVGFVFQFHHLLNDFTALENVMMPGWIQAGKVTNLQSQAMALLEEVGVDHRARQKPSQLSGGEQQRVAIARALANQPAVLLADEPTGNLDQETGEKVSALLLELNRRRGLTLILVTHNSHLAERMDHVYFLEDGRLNSARIGQAHG
ncbi:MAG: ABC transporter ATP-binding protein [Deltaproteobacteria bacterium]|nr:ABC transporter ATP-binding protein [Deltaproteobacteria bacterium]